MFIAKNSEWNNSHTDLSKYFIEKLKQRVDFEEIISNRHRTTNGYTLICEIAEVAELTQKRIKSVHRLISLVEESKNNLISSSIVNDFILKEYHSDIVQYYSNFNTNRLRETGKELNELLNKSKINAQRLEFDYLSNIRFELKNIDFASTQFTRNAEILDKLIDCLVPYLLFQAYSTTSISDIAFRYVWKENANSSPYRIVSNFDGSNKPYCFLVKTEGDRQEFRAILDYLDSKKIEYEETNIEALSELFHGELELCENEKLYIIKDSTLDPHNFLRNIYEMGLKNYVVSQDRLSLQFFTNFFSFAHWRFDRTNHRFQKSNIALDPINVPKRNSTLRSTLTTLNDSLDLGYSENDSIPVIKEIRDSLYYYNLALGSKSIENSLSLLWTSLETLLPYRLKDSDIENVQYFVSKSLGMGAIGREIISFARRFLETNRLNNNTLANLGLYTTYLNYSPDGIKKWIEWLNEEFEAESDSDPYNALKPVSNLLCKQYCFLNEVFTGKHSKLKSVEYWLNKIKSSELSIKYQLDRIYLHRNQIVHSGKFINEYSNLWSHLEWYVGKLLAYGVIDYLKKEDKTNFNKEHLFMQLEADADLLSNLLENNKEKRIKEIFFAYKLVTKHSWQFF